MPIKKSKKMYKSGKMWVTAGLATFIVGGVEVVTADTLSQNNANQVTHHDQQALSEITTILLSGVSETENASQLDSQTSDLNSSNQANSQDELASENQISDSQSISDETKSSEGLSTSQLTSDSETNSDLLSDSTNLSESQSEPFLVMDSQTSNAQNSLSEDSTSNTLSKSPSMSDVYVMDSTEVSEYLSNSTSDSESEKVSESIKASESLVASASQSDSVSYSLGHRNPIPQPNEIYPSNNDSQSNALVVSNDDPNDHNGTDSTMVSNNNIIDTITNLMPVVYADSLTGNTTQGTPTSSKETSIANSKQEQTQTTADSNTHEVSKPKETINTPQQKNEAFPWYIALPSAVAFAGFIYLTAKKRQKEQAD